MRAIRVDQRMEPDDLRCLEVDVPQPAPDEVRIEIKAAGCNFSDLLMLKGEYQVKPTLPFVPGGEVAGIVRELGSQVDGLAIGDRVLSRCALGGFAEQVAAPELAAQLRAELDAWQARTNAPIPTLPNPECVLAPLGSE